jgi:hypothetical protein
LLVPACGAGDDGLPVAGDGGLEDAWSPDSYFECDGAGRCTPPFATRAGTIAIADVRVTTPGAAAVGGIRGGAIDIEFSDLTLGGGEVVFGTSPIGGCTVTRYDADGTPNAPHPAVDAGTVTIANPGDEESGLLKPVGPCTFSEGRGYACSSHGGLTNGVTVSPGANDTATYVLSAQDFTGVDLEGAYLTVSGFTEGGNNSGAAAFPIIRQLGATGNNLVVVNPGAAAEAVVDNVNFGILNGAGPIPVGAGGDANFLALEVDQIRVTKPADDDWPAIDFTTYTRGEGFDLDDASAEAHEFPTTAVDMDFSCAGVGGNCGADGDATLEALIVSGRTTDAPIPGAPYPDYLMPDPVTQYATFQCGFLLQDSARLPSGAVEAILSTDPTRVEVRVLRVAGTVLQDSENANAETRILIGHGVVGHTDIP